MVVGDRARSSSDPVDEMYERAITITRTMRDLAPVAAYALSAWDPCSGTHRHVTLASEGFSDSLLGHVNDEYVRDNPGFHLLHTRGLAALRWRDFKREWGLDFAKTRTAEEYAIPEGFHEGSTACLWRPDGRYTGALHVSWANPRAATDDRRDVIEQFRPLLASVCDMLGSAQIVADSAAPGAHAVLLAPNDVACDVPGRATGPHLGGGGALREVVSSSTPRSRFLWADASGECHRVEIFPCRGDTLLVTERSLPWPYGLTPRELEILDLISQGLSNPQIGTILFVSPRTVSKHVEHLLEKLDCASRSQMAAMAVREGLLLSHAPSAELV